VGRCIDGRRIYRSVTSLSVALLVLLLVLRLALLLLFLAESPCSSSCASPCSSSFSRNQVYSKVDDVTNLSTEQENMGKLYVTNIRVVWFSEKSDNYNVSIPYIQMKMIKIRQSKFGSAIVIESGERSGGYVLGFRAEPLSRLQGIFKEIQSLCVGGVTSVGGARSKRG
jgi:hypothetical protein